MRLGFYIKWNKNSLFANAKGNVLGDELLAESFCRALRKFDDVEEVRVYAPNAPIERTLDAVIYLNDNPPCREWAKKHILYLQNGYECPEIEKFLQKFYEHGYDGYMFFAKSLVNAHERTGREGIYLPFGVDTVVFSPQDKSDRYGCEVSYVGNDIKGTERTMLYLYPATAFDFALYGNWDKPLWKNGNLEENLPPYKKVFRDRSRGKIPQDEGPVLYSNSIINLNCTLQTCVDWDVITLRTYEVLACKGFLITDKTPSAESILKGKVVFTDGDGDLVEKIKYYLAHDDERLAIAEKGYEHVIQHESITSRAKILVDYLRSIVA
jgi:spore maturation protein CgeB